MTGFAPLTGSGRGRGGAPNHIHKAPPVVTGLLISVNDQFCVLKKPVAGCQHKVEGLLLKLGFAARGCENKLVILSISLSKPETDEEKPNMSFRA